MNRRIRVARVGVILSLMLMAVGCSAEEKLDVNDAGEISDVACACELPCGCLEANDAGSCEGVYCSATWCSAALSAASAAYPANECTVDSDCEIWGHACWSGGTYEARPIGLELTEYNRLMSLHGAGCGPIELYCDWFGCDPDAALCNTNHQCQLSVPATCDGTP